MSEQQTQAIQRREREPLPFVPSNVEEAWRTSELLAKASLLPDALKGKPHDILVAVMTGAELGLSPMIATREIYIVKGKPFIGSRLRVSLIRQSPLCILWEQVESTHKRAVYRAQRRGDPRPTTMEFTIEEAERAGLVAQNAKYKTEPKLMLALRCQSRLGDELFPDILRGVGDRDSDAWEVEGEVVDERATRRAVVLPPHLRQTQAEETPAVEGQVVEAAPEQAEAEVPPSGNGELAPVDALNLALHEAQTPEDVAAVGKRIKAARQAGHITEAQRQELGAVFTSRQREVRQ